MRFEKEIGGGRAFMELERRGNGYVIGRRGFATRANTKGFQPAQPWQGTESPLIHDGSQNILSTAFDFRNSTLTGSTLAGPNGSGQFLGVFVSAARTISLCSTTFLNLSTVSVFYGICQNKPRPGDAVDVGIFGVTKMVCGSTSITPGTALQMSSTNAGVVVPWAGGNGRPIGFAIEGSLTVGQVFAGFIGPMPAPLSS